MLNKNCTKTLRILEHHKHSDKSRHLIFRQGFGEVSEETDFWIGLDVLKFMTHARHYSTVKVQLRDARGGVHSAKWAGQRWFRIGAPNAYYENYALARSFNFDGTGARDELKDLLPEGKFKTRVNVMKTLARKQNEFGLVHTCAPEVLNGGWWFGIDSNTQFKNNTCPVKSNLNAEKPYFAGIPNIVETSVKFRI